MADVQVTTGHRRHRADVYTRIEVTTKRRKMLAHLDTGAELSVCPLRYVRSSRYIIPVSTKVYAVNGTPIRITGATRIYFEIQGKRFYADVLVSEDVKEILLGYNFLESFACEWLFRQRRIIIDGMSVPLRNPWAKSESESPVPVHVEVNDQAPCNTAASTDGV